LQVGYDEWMAEKGFKKIAKQITPLKKVKKQKAA